MKKYITYTAQAYSPKQTTQLIVRGSLIATCLLTLLLVFYDIGSHAFTPKEYLVMVIISFVYLFIGEWLLRTGKQQSVNWMLIVFYEFLAFYTLLCWGLNSPIGILSITFAVILPSVLMGSQTILPVAGITITTIVTVQLVHASGAITPNLTSHARLSTGWDVITYATILSVFALVSWLSGRQRERNLQRALQAEAKLQLQKESLSVELEKESTALRHAQLNQVKELHKFALLGQSAAATLHELSNHLSVLNLDIDDLQQQHYNSRAIARAKQSIEHINKMVRQARLQLNSYDQQEVFNASPVIYQCLKDMRSKFTQHNIKLTVAAASKGKFLLNGSPLALMQIITVLLNNALDACCDMTFAEVTLSINKTPTHLTISIIDNGKGVDSVLQRSLFSPMVSTKPTGMGIGLYIARHLVENQFHGTIKLISTAQGAHFKITLPKKF